MQVYARPVKNCVEHSLRAAFYSAQETCTRKTRKPS